jgi:hypothetical protein
VEEEEKKRTAEKIQMEEKKIWGESSQLCKDIKGFCHQIKDLKHNNKTEPIYPTTTTSSRRQALSAQRCTCRKEKTRK